MNYIIESLFVGIYTCCIYFIFSPFIQNFYLLLLVCGFFKHFLGSTFGLWTWYCNNGNACIKLLNNNSSTQQNNTKYKTKYKSNTLHLITDSIYESITFLVIGTILSCIIVKDIYLYFAIGVILHIIGEKIGIHKIFCYKNCNKET
jgi:hypothetical protein